MNAKEASALEAADQGPRAKKARLSDNQTESEVATEDSGDG